MAQGPVQAVSVFPSRSFPNRLHPPSGGSVASRRRRRWIFMCSARCRRLRPAAGASQPTLCSHAGARLPQGWRGRGASPFPSNPHRSKGRAPCTPARRCARGSGAIQTPGPAACSSDSPTRRRRSAAAAIWRRPGKRPIKPARGGFKALKSSCAAIKGFEAMRALRKGRGSAFNPTSDMNGEARIIERAFGPGPAGYPRRYPCSKTVRRHEAGSQFIAKLRTL